MGIFGFYGAKLIPESFCGTEEFLTLPFWYRMVYLLIAVEVGFTKYYFAWFNGEAHTILIGAAYNGRSKSGSVLWTRIQMLDLIPFRLAHNRFMIHSNWNICSGEWLKYCKFIHYLLLSSYLTGYYRLVFENSCTSNGCYKPSHYHIYCERILAWILPWILLVLWIICILLHCGRSL